MLAIDELNSTIKRIDLIIANSESLEERTMAVIVKNNLMPMLMQLDKLPGTLTFEQLCNEQKTEEEKQDQ